MRRRRLIEATEDWGTDLEGLDTGSLRTCEGGGGYVVRRQSPARHESALHMESRGRCEVERWANTEGSKSYGKFPNSRFLSNREIGNW
ncbi:hypothetical protein [Thermobaculum terrenum]|nr:hypothetical protein [Thermobaculum terrenum]